MIKKLNDGVEMNKYNKLFTENITLYPQLQNYIILFSF